MWESIILNKLIEVPLLAYSVLFVGMAVEGEVALLAGIFSAELGYLDLRLVIVTALAGMWIGDIGWYYLGGYIEPFLPHRKITQMVPFIDRAIVQRPFATLSISKFAYFLHRFILIRMHQLRITPRQFIRMDAIAGGFWFIIIAALGIGFSASFVLLRHYIRIAEVGLVVIILIAGFAEHLVGKYLRKKLQRF